MERLLGQSGAGWLDATQSFRKSPQVQQVEDPPAPTVTTLLVALAGPPPAPTLTADADAALVVADVVEVASDVEAPLLEVDDSAVPPLAAPPMPSTPVTFDEHAAITQSPRTAAALRDRFIAHLRASRSPLRHMTARVHGSGRANFSAAREC